MYAVDTNPEFLEFIKKSAEENRLKNIETVLAKEGKLILPEKSLDWLFMRNVTHHISNRVEYFKNLIGLMKPDGKVAIIEYKRGGLFSFRWVFGHYVAQETIVKEMEETGYRLERDFDFLPKQSFTIFSLKK